MRSSKVQHSLSASRTSTPPLAPTNTAFSARPTAPNRLTVPYSYRWWNVSSMPSPPRFARNALAYIGSDAIIPAGIRFTRSSQRKSAITPRSTKPGIAIASASS